MIEQVFCRWIMGLHGATEFIGFSIPERNGLTVLLLVFFLFLPIGGLGYEM